MTALSPSPVDHRSITLDSPVWNHAKAPVWYSELQHEAWRSFASMPWPSRKDEAWRFADLGQLQFDQFHKPAGGTQDEELTELSRGINHPAAKLVFVNDRLVSLANRSSVQLLDLPQALASRNEQIKSLLLGAMSELGSAKFVALHQAQLRNVAVILAPKRTIIERPIEIFHWQQGDRASAFPRTLVLAEEGASVTVIEHHCSADEAPTFSCGLTQLAAAQHSSIAYVLAERRNRSAKAIHLSRTHVAQDAKVIHFLANLGGAWTRTECVSHLTGPGARSDMLSISLTDSTEESDQRTLQLHEAPHATSDLLYKNVLFGKSRSIFAGLIRVDDDAHYTDAYQTCRNLLMTDQCEANAMPGLEINADQVKCSHGSTTGAIDPEELFYLASRGIQDGPARALIAQGFLNQVVERLADEEISEFLRSQVAARFDAAAC